MKTSSTADIHFSHAGLVSRYQRLSADVAAMSRADVGVPAWECISAPLEDVSALLVVRLPRTDPKETPSGEPAP